MSFFLRCALFHRIPADSEIQKLGICLTSACNCCSNRQLETPEHILLHGQQAQEVWSFFSLALQQEISSSDSVLIRFLRWSVQGQKSSRYGFVCYILPFLIMWNLWIARNQARYEGTPHSSTYLIQSVKAQLFEIMAFFKTKALDSREKQGKLEAIGLVPEHQRQVLCIPVAWQKPGKGHLKLNADGASRGNPGKEGAGGGLRDSKGKMIFAFSFYLGVGSSFQAEVRALLIG